MSEQTHAYLERASGRGFGDDDGIRELGHHLLDRGVHLWQQTDNATGCENGTGKSFSWGLEHATKCGAHQHGLLRCCIHAPGTVWARCWCLRTRRKAAQIIAPSAGCGWHEEWCATQHGVGCGASPAVAKLASGAPVWRAPAQKEQ